MRENSVLSRGSFEATERLVSHCYKVVTSSAFDVGVATDRSFPIVLTQQRWDALATEQ